MKHISWASQWINIGENRRGDQEWTIQRNWQYRRDKTHGGDKQCKYTTHKTKKMSNTHLIWQLRYKFITDNINLVFDDLFTFVFLRVYLLGHGGASHDSFPVSTSSPLHGWPPYCGCGLLHALARVFVFNTFQQETEHSPHSLHFVYVPHFPSTIP